MMSSTGQARWFVREEGEKAMEEAEGEQKESIVPGQGQHMQRLRIDPVWGQIMLMSPLIKDSHLGSLLRRNLGLISKAIMWHIKFIICNNMWKAIK